VAEAPSNGEPGPEGPPSGEPGPGADRSDVTRFVTETTGRIQEIIDAAERVAAQIRAEAEADAQSYLEQQRRAADHVVSERVEDLAALADDLSQQASDLRSQSGQIVSALERAAARLRAALPVPSAGSTEAPRAEVELQPDAEVDLQPDGELDLQPAAQVDLQPAAEVDLQPEPGQAAPARKPEGARPLTSLENPDAALLRAAQLAVAGSGRTEIEAALRRDFGVVEPADILDQILPPEQV
jgi:hypothetical protein